MAAGNTEEGKAQGGRREITVGRAKVRMLQTAAGVLLATYFIVVAVYAHGQKAELRCTEIKTDVHTTGNDVLITDRGLRSLVKSEFPTLMGTPLSDVNYDELERQIEELDVVRRCEAYPTMGGSVHIEIYQRKPIMRVFTGESSYYMDEEGYKITSLPGMRTHCLIVNGHANNMLDPTPLIDLCRHINRDSFWKSMIEQVFVTRKGEFILVPRVGNHVVEFGTTAKMEQKFDKLMKLYKRGWNKDEWNIYSRVNLKYEGQIICTKR